jgi:hypothetical protein
VVLLEDLTPEQRDRIQADLTTRAARAENSEWRAVWEAELHFLNGRSDDAVAKLEQLALSKNQDVAVAALLSLGDWHEFSGTAELARAAYRQAIEIGGEPAVLTRTKLARLHNLGQEPARASEVLESTAAEIDNVPADVVQFVVAEYIQALREVGRVEDARTFVGRVTKCFPDRAEVALIARHVLGEAD